MMQTIRDSTEKSELRLLEKFFARRIAIFLSLLGEPCLREPLLEIQNLVQDEVSCITPATLAKSGQIKPGAA